LLGNKFKKNNEKNSLKKTRLKLNLKKNCLWPIAAIAGKEKKTRVAYRCHTPECISVNLPRSTVNMAAGSAAGGLN